MCVCVCVYKSKLKDIRLIGRTSNRYTRQSGKGRGNKSVRKPEEKDVSLEKISKEVEDRG